MRGIRRAIIAATAVLAGIAAAPGAAQAAETWTQVGGTISAAPVASEQYGLERIAGAPHVAWTDTGGAADVVRVARLDSAGAWVAVGGPVNTDPGDRASDPSLVAGPGDVPWISWLEQDDDGLRRVRVARYDAPSAKWVEVAPNSLINERHGVPYEPMLSGAVQTKIVFVGGRAHVIFRQDNPTAYEINHVGLSADGNSWERLGRVPDGAEPYFSTAHVSGGSLYAAARSFLGGVVVSRYTAAGTWEQLGGLANPAPEGEPLTVSSSALASVDGVIHVLHGADPAVYVTRFVNGSWEIVDGIIGEGPVSSLRAIGGRLHAAWTGGRAAQVHRLDAAETGFARTAPLPIGTRAPVLTGVGGVPYAAVQGPDGRLEVFRLADEAPERPDPPSPNPPGPGPTPPGPNPPGPNPPGPEPAAHGPCGPRLLGTNAADRLTGGPARNHIAGRSGADTILGLGGDDCLFGNAGDDVLKGGAGTDRLEGGSGHDRLVSGDGNDSVKAGPGNDVVDSRGRGRDTIDCGPGRDRALVGDLDRVRNCERVLNVD